MFKGRVSEKSVCNTSLSIFHPFPEDFLNIRRCTKNLKITFLLFQDLDEKVTELGRRTKDNEKLASQVTTPFV